jgi:hypothetical protein
MEPANMLSEDIRINSVPLNYDFSQFLEVVEFVNQPHALLINILNSNPRLKGIFFGKAEHIDAIRDSLAENIKQRCEFIKGDLLTSILPSGFQVYLLKDIIDSFDKEQTIDFFNRCYQVSDTYTRFLLLQKSDNNLDDAAKYQKVKENYSDILQTDFILTNVIKSVDIDIIEVLRR